MVHALLLRMHTNVVYFRVMRRLCRREWNWLWIFFFFFIFLFYLTCFTTVPIFYAWTRIHDNGHVITHAHQCCIFQRLCRREWNWLWTWLCVNPHPWQRTRDHGVWRLTLTAYWHPFVLRDVIGGEVDDGADEVVPDDDLADGLPVGGGLTQQHADGLEGQLDHGWWVGHGSQLHQVLLLDPLHSCKVGEKIMSACYWKVMKCLFPFLQTDLNSLSLEIFAAKFDKDTIMCMQVNH